MSERHLIRTAWMPSSPTTNPTCNSNRLNAYFKIMLTTPMTACALSSAARNHQLWCQCSFGIKFSVTRRECAYQICSHEGNHVAAASSSSQMAQVPFALQGHKAWLPTCPLDCLHHNVGHKHMLYMGITRDTSCMLTMFLSPVRVVTHTGTKSKWEAEHPRTLQECNKTALDSCQHVDSMLHAECTRLTDWLASASYKSSTIRLMEAMSSWW